MGQVWSIETLKGTLHYSTDVLYIHVSTKTNIQNIHITTENNVAKGVKNLSQYLQ